MALDINEDPAFARKEWRVQRGGWVAMLVILAIALTGALGESASRGVVRAAVIYGFLVIIFRVAGRRSMTEITTFDLVLVLIISEATQQAMVESDNSIIRSVIVITTLVGIDIGLSLFKERLPKAGKVLDGLPVIVVRDGKLLEYEAKYERVNKEEILAEARRAHGLERLEQVKYAIVEEGGDISIIPK